LIAYGRQAAWVNAPEYLLRSLPGHAAAAGMIDDLLADDDYLLHADLRRLVTAGDHGTSPRVRLIGLTPEAAAAGSNERAALFSVTQALEAMPITYANADAAPYLARWARARPSGARAVLEGHQGGVRAVCPVTVSGRAMLATVGNDATVRIWDPAAGRQAAVLEGHQDWVNAVCPVTVSGRAMLATASADRTVRIWDPAIRQPVLVIPVHHTAHACAQIGQLLVVGLSAGALALDATAGG